MKAMTAILMLAALGIAACDRNYDNTLKIAFVRELTAGVPASREIFIMDEDGRNLVRITNNSLEDGAPSFSPDGTRIVFFRDTGANYELMIINADGTGERQITSDGYYKTFPTWSPDGNRILCCILGSFYQVAVMNPDGGGVHILTIDLTMKSSPSWSPDGSGILYCENTSIIRKIDRYGTMMPFNAPTGIQPTWAPDGSRYASIDGMLRFYDPMGNLISNSIAPYGDPSWSPDGSAIAYADGGDINVYYFDGGYSVNLTGDGGTYPDSYPSFQGKPR